MSNYDHPFSEGQRVRCVAADAPAQVGDVLTVTRAAPRSALFRGYYFGVLCTFINDRFEPYVETPITADVDFPRYQQDRQVENLDAFDVTLSCGDCGGEVHENDGPCPSDPVFRPNHYARFTIEPITFIQANSLPFDIGNVIKYACRYDAKDGLQDLQKARRYLDIRIETLSREARIEAGEDAQTVWAGVL